MKVYAKFRYILTVLFFIATNTFILTNPNGTVTKKPLPSIKEAAQKTFIRQLKDKNIKGAWENLERNGLNILKKLQKEHPSDYKNLINQQDTKSQDLFCISQFKKEISIF